MNISVAMAVYNGGKYLREQLDSILKQLDEMDELIISYNDSTDDTLKILEEYRSEEHFETVFKNTLCHCTGAICNRKHHRHLRLHVCRESRIWKSRHLCMMQWF